MSTVTDVPNATTSSEAQPLHRAVLESPEGGAGLLYPQTAGGVALSAFGVGISAASLSLANAHVVSPTTGGFFVPVALGTGALALLVGGLWEFRGGRAFSGTFGVVYAGFLISTGLIIQFFAGPATEAAGGNAVGDALGAYLLLWCGVTVLLTICAAKLNWPAFLAFLFLALALFFGGLGNVVGIAPGSTGDLLNRIGGWCGLVDAAVAFYLGLSILLAELHGREILPAPAVLRA